MPETIGGPESGGTEVKLPEEGPRDPMSPAKEEGREGLCSGREKEPDAGGSKPGLGFRQPEMKPRVAGECGGVERAGQVGGTSGGTTG